MSVGRRGWVTGALIALGCTASACDSGEPADGPSGPRSLVTSAISGGGSSNGGLAPLASVAVPQLVGGDIVDTAAAVRLGKALFWDAQTGGDGQVACASCHFHGGADSRLLNALNPGPDGVFASGGVTSAGQLLSPSAISNDDRVGSQGVVGSLFAGVNPDPAVAADICTPDLSAPFFSERRVTGRNAPPVVGAVFNRDDFWDGRANHTFNGLDPFGNTPNGGGGLSIANGSLASQAVGPPNNGTEMSCAGRGFNGPGSLAEKLLARQPLAHQLVSPGDGVLGALSAAPANGLTVTYQDLIAAAFPADLTADDQAQFSRIWGQAIQAYEATLIPDETPLDRYLAGNSTALTAAQKRGLDLFSGKGGCSRCHTGPELTDASVGFSLTNGLVNEDGGDQGFHNLGVRPTAEDLGRAGCPSAPCDNSGPGHFPNSVSGSTRDRGAFKTAALRDVKLTAPYFHNGGKASLEQVVTFYNQGGDFANPEKAKRIKPLSLSASDQTALVAFLRDGLTDCRVENQLAPFDHPALSLPNGDALPALGADGTGPCP